MPPFKSLRRRIVVAYLTFAAHRYLSHVRGLPTRVTGIESGQVITTGVLNVANPANLVGLPWIVVPKVHWTHTKERVNVQDFIDGVPGHDLRRLEAEGLDRVFKDFGAEWRFAGCSSRFADGVASGSAGCCSSGCSQARGVTTCSGSSSTPRSGPASSMRRRCGRSWSSSATTPAGRSGPP